MIIPFLNILKSNKKIYIKSDGIAQLFELIKKLLSFDLVILLKLLIFFDSFINFHLRRFKNHFLRVNLKLKSIDCFGEHYVFTLRNIILSKF
jgi:hypothetical protein